MWDVSKIVEKSLQIIKPGLNFVQDNMKERTAKLLYQSSSRKREIWYDVEYWPVISEFFALGKKDVLLPKELRTRQYAFQRLIELVAESKSTRDQFEKECHEKSCIWSMKLFKGGQNTRIFCHHENVGGVDRYVLAFLIPKKNTQALGSRLNKRISIVAGYEYNYMTQI